MRSLPGGGGDRRAAFGALEPSAFAVPTKGSEGPDAVFACDARGTALVPTDAAAPPARVLDAGCVQGLVGEGAGWRVFFVDATHSAASCGCFRELSTGKTMKNRHRHAW